MIVARKDYKASVREFVSEIRDLAKEARSARLSVTPEATPSAAAAADEDVIVDNDESENDYVWGPQHLFNIGRYYEYTTYAANSGRQIVSSLRNRLLPVDTTQTSASDDLAQVDVIEAKQEEDANNVDAKLQQQQLPPESSLPYKLAAESSRVPSRLDSYSVHTETYVFESDHGDGTAVDGDEGNITSLFSREASIGPPEVDEKSFETAEEGERSVEVSLVDEDDNVSSGDGACDRVSTASFVDAHDQEEPVNTASNTLSGKDELLPAEQQQQDGADVQLNESSHKSTLRSEVIEILQEDIGKVNDAFLDTLHKTSELVVQPVAARARSGGPVHQRLYAVSQSLSHKAMDVTRSVSESASAVIPSNLGEKSTKLLEQAHKAEEAIANSAGEAISRVRSSVTSSSAGEALSHVHVSTVASSIVSAGVDVIENFEDAVEALRVDDIDACDDAEMLSGLTAGAYA